MEKIIILSKNRRQRLLYINNMVNRYASRVLDKDRYVLKPYFNTKKWKLCSRVANSDKNQTALEQLKHPLHFPTHTKLCFNTAREELEVT
jgi:hypothetical protein